MSVLKQCDLCGKQFAAEREKVTEHELSWINSHGVRQNRDVCTKCSRALDEYIANNTTTR